MDEVKHNNEVPIDQKEESIDDNLVSSSNSLISESSNLNIQKLIDMIPAENTSELEFSEINSADNKIDNIQNIKKDNIINKKEEEMKKVRHRPFSNLEVFVNNLKNANKTRDQKNKIFINSKNNINMLTSINRDKFLNKNKYINTKNINCDLFRINKINHANNKKIQLPNFSVNNNTNIDNSKNKSNKNIFEFKYKSLRNNNNNFIYSKTTYSNSLYETNKNNQNTSLQSKAKKLLIGLKSVKFHDEDEIEQYKAQLNENENKKNPFGLKEFREKFKNDFSKNNQMSNYMYNNQKSNYKYLKMNFLESNCNRHNMLKVMDF